MSILETVLCIWGSFLGQDFFYLLLLVPIPLLGMYAASNYKARLLVVYMVAKCLVVLGLFALSVYMFRQFSLCKGCGSEDGEVRYLNLFLSLSRPFV